MIFEKYNMVSDDGNVPYYKYKFKNSQNSGGCV